MLIDRVDHAVSFSIVTQKYVVVCKSRLHADRNMARYIELRDIIVVTRNLYNVKPNEATNLFKF